MSTKNLTLYIARQVLDNVKIQELFYLFLKLYYYNIKYKLKATKIPQKTARHTNKISFISVFFLYFSSLLKCSFSPLFCFSIIVVSFSFFLSFLFMILSFLISFFSSFFVPFFFPFFLF